MKRIILQVTVAAILTSCAPGGKIEALRHNGTAASISLPGSPAPEFDKIEDALSDTLHVRDYDGNELMIMNAVKDENGEMVAHDNIKAAVVTARFRNVAERNGKVDIAFDILVPKDMTDSEWMLRFRPKLTANGNVTELENLQVTGKKYRQRQLRGYERYRKFLSTIVTDSLQFVNMHQLEMFLRRNLPQIYRFRTDSSVVSSEEFLSEYGVSQQRAVRHYTNGFLVRRNRRRVLMKDKMREKFIRMPISEEGLRIDTVIAEGCGDIIYRYIQSINVSSTIKKVTVSLSGDIYEEDRLLLQIPESKPLDFYISSLSSLADESPHYIQNIVYRNAAVNTACYIDFEMGSSEVSPTRGNNRSEIGRIKQNLIDLMENNSFDMDSIMITASCSPEGSFKSNDVLAAARAESVRRFFDSFVSMVSDSLGAATAVRRIRFTTHSQAENWPMLDALVEKDTLLDHNAKEDYVQKSRTSDPDTRETALQQEGYYPYLRSVLYPQLRIVRFDFFLHRKGMIKDTVHTTLPDSLYAKGVAAIKERDYKSAIEILRPYKDYNSAVAYCAAGYNASAKEILESLERNDRVLYLLAIIHSRTGHKQDAIQCYLDACKKNPSLVSRGNLDPEISSLIKEYNLQDYLLNN